jgi:ABC-type branched-subunit amino acid transport system ATPase component/ABC-type branched-subunit amino acid transport system permease subunit
MIGTGRDERRAAAIPDGDAAVSEDGSSRRRAGLATPTPGLILPAMVLCLGLVGEFLLPGHLTYAASTALCYGLVGLGLYLPLAVLRELPLNGAGLAGLSAYLFAYHASHGGSGHSLVGIVVGVGVCVGVSVVGGLTSLVVTGLYFTVGSLVVQIGIEKVVFSVGSLTGGAAGRGVAQPELTGWFNTNRAVFLITGVVCVMISAGMWKVKRSKILSNWIMTGHQPDGADAVGIRKWAQKLVIFGVSGLLIGIAGVLFAFVNGTPPPPPQFGVIWSVIFLAIPIASGLRTLSALWLVAAVFTALPVILESHHINANLLSGGILLGALVTSQSQNAVMARLRRLRRQADVIDDTTPNEDHRLLGDLDKVADTVVPHPRLRSVDPRETDPGRTLVGTDIGVTFGGVNAVDGVNISVGAGQRLAIVGANGAGKTTLFNALTGFVPLSRGAVRLGGSDVTRMPAYARIRAGIGRTFQIPRLAEVLTVRQNIVCGQTQPSDLAQRADWLMERFALTALADIPVQVMPFGTRRKIEMVRALARRPEILLIDEPVSGLEDHEVSELLEVLLQLQAAEGWGLIVIEHDLRFVTGVADQMMVMIDGHVLTEGPLEEVLADQRVRQVYLGEVVV